MAKDEFASAMTEGSVGLPSPDLQVCHWIRWDWIRVDQIGLADTGQGFKQLNQNLSTRRVTSRLYKESRPCLVLGE